MAKEYDPTKRMSITEILQYAADHPNDDSLASDIRRNYHPSEISILLEEAALKGRGISQCRLMQRLASDEL